MQLEANIRQSLPRVPNMLMAMFCVIGVETMLFAAFISAYLVNRTGATVLLWPPPGQPRLPVESTAFNSLFLLASGYTMYLAFKAMKRPQNRAEQILKWLKISAFLGATFVILQGKEWLNLIGFGLTATSSLYGAFFYLIIGAHAFHVLVGIIIIAIVLKNLQNNQRLLDSHSVFIKSQTGLLACCIYWFFVVGLWPILYYLVYLL